MDPIDPQFEALLTYLKEARGFDFTGYKRSSLMRRVARRMSQVGSADNSEYRDFLQVHPDEFAALFNTILINVTGFFRDPDAWDHLRTEILPPVLAAKSGDAPVRVWSAGCASGEEAYTLAIVLAELLGPKASGTGSRSTPRTWTRRRWPTPGSPPTPAGTSPPSPTAWSRPTSSRSPAAGTSSARSCAGR